MPKDLKIGILLGLVLVAAAVGWLATRPSLSVRSRMQLSHNAGQQQLSTEHAPLIADSQNASSAETNQTNIPDFTVYEQTEKIKTQKFHIVRKGQTLSGIAEQYYGSAKKWQKIHDANRKIIKDVNKLRPGTKLIIPN